MVLLEEFCLCVPLKKGGKIIAVACIVTSLISCIMLSIYLTSDFDDIAREIGDHDQAMINKLKENKTSAQTSASILLLVSLALLVTSALLFKGIQNEAKQRFIPFLVVLAITIILTIIVAFIQFNVGPFYATMTLMLVFVYFFISIFSLYQSMIDHKYNQGGVESN